MQTRSLKTKIYSGFAIISLLLLLTALASIFSLRQLADGRDAIRSVETANEHALNIDRDLQELRTRVNRYVSGGSDSQLQTIRNTHQRVAHLIDTAAAQTPDVDMQNSFKQIRKHVDRYASLFDNMARERHLRRSLIQDVLPGLASAIERGLSASATNAEDAAAALAIEEIQSSVLRAERAMIRYFSNPETGAVDEAVTHLHRAREQASRVDISNDLQTYIQANLADFERVSLRAVQATRSYLFFVNVTMADQASEVAYYASKLREVTERRRAEISSKALSTSTKMSRVTAAISALAIGLSLFIAARLGLILVPSIVRLTCAFEKLAVGRTDVNLPDSPRTDEIGRMTRAANSFGDQNRKTQDLLHESERLRRALELNATQLEATNKELDDFAYVASHDLKSPLRGIRQLAIWVREDAGESMPQDAADHLERLVARVDKMEALLEDLLNYSRAGRVEPEAEFVDLTELFATVIELTDNPYNVQIRLPESAPRICVVAPPLAQVLRNLIGNAVHHNDKNAEGRVEVFVRTDGEWCYFRVSDNGPGIDPDNHKRAFKMYQRVGQSRGQGSGMGLSIIKKQVEARGGTISLTSTLGNGATFEFSWPIAANGAMNQQRRAS